MRSSAIPGKQKTKTTGPVVLHTLKPQLTVGKMCPSINAGYLSAGQQLIWLAVSLVWTRLSDFPQLLNFLPFSPSLRDHNVYTVLSLLLFSLLHSTAQAFLWPRHFKASASL